MPGVDPRRLATTPYHFHRAAPYGVVANLLAMPVVLPKLFRIALRRRAAQALTFEGPPRSVAAE